MKLCRRPYKQKWNISKTIWAFFLLKKTGEAELLCARGLHLGGAAVWGFAWISSFDLIANVDKHQRKSTYENNAKSPVFSNVAFTKLYKIFCFRRGSKTLQNHTIYAIYPVNTDTFELYTKHQKRHIEVLWTLQQNTVFTMFSAHGPAKKLVFTRFWQHVIFPFFWDQNCKNIVSYRVLYFLFYRPKTYIFYVSWLDMPGKVLRQAWPFLSYGTGR